METLVQDGLFGQGLVPVSGVLARRYNACLAAMGLTETKLERFSIDGWGWSPEVAVERGNPLYLSHGLANPLAIILTPEQHLKPMYFPFHSFDRSLMKRVFKYARPQIADLTIQTGIWLDIEDELSEYADPEDLVIIDTITVKFATPCRIMQAAQEQRAMVQRFKEERLAWTDGTLRGQILESAKAHGDLRYRSLVIPDMPFSVRSFSTRAFGGVFVFRDLKNHEYLIVVEDAALAVPVGKKSRGLRLHIGDVSLPDVLVAEGLATADPAYFKDHDEDLTRLLDCLFVDSYCAACPKIDVCSFNSARRKGCITTLKKSGSLPDLYGELERYARRIRSNMMPKRVSKGLKRLLLHPAANLDKDSEAAVRQLLAAMEPADVLRLYTHDKERFYAVYKTWPEGKRKWAAAYIKERYKPVMLQDQA